MSYVLWNTTLPFKLCLMKCLVITGTSTSKKTFFRAMVSWKSEKYYKCFLLGKALESLHQTSFSSKEIGKATWDENWSIYLVRIYGKNLKTTVKYTDNFYYEQLCVTVFQDEEHIKLNEFVDLLINPGNFSRNQHALLTCKENRKTSLTAAEKKYKNNRTYEIWSYCHRRKDRRNDLSKHFPCPTTPRRIVCTSICATDSQAGDCWTGSRHATGRIFMSAGPGYYSAPPRRGPAGATHPPLTGGQGV